MKDYLVGLFTLLETKSAVKKALHKKQIKVNGQIGETGYWVKAMDEIVYERKSTKAKINTPNLKIVFEDKHILIIYKPPGLSSSGNQRSLQHYLEGIELIDEGDTLDYPQLVHRLDKATEGLMLAAKTMPARRKLSAMLEAQELSKHYVLIAEGWLPNGMKVIEHEIEGKTAITKIIKYHPLKTTDKTTAVWVKLITGRTHQIRKHFSAIGHGLVGDTVYNSEGLSFKSGLLLCAFSLEFEHPVYGERLHFTIPIPRKIYKYLHKKID